MCNASAAVEQLKRYIYIYTNPAEINVLCIRYMSIDIFFAHGNVSSLYTVSRNKRNATKSARKAIFVYINANFAFNDQTVRPRVYIMPAAECCATDVRYTQRRGAAYRGLFASRYELRWVRSARGILCVDRGAKRIMVVASHLIYSMRARDVDFASSYFEYRSAADAAVGSQR